VNGAGCKVASSDDAVVAVSTHVSSLALIAVVAAVSVVVDADVVVILQVVSAFFALSHHFFFFLLHFPCPGPGMLVVGRWQAKELVYQ
jgi:hypothetical protein